jgi:hypothetical protein
MGIFHRKKYEHGLRSSKGYKNAAKNRLQEKAKI